jgi:predicted glycoside hydrolase/deacetylase ChbG (UPF0249 family)
MNKKQLIVNADDYGHTEGVSAGIREAHLHGLVSSTSAMMNRPFVRQALTDALEQTPRLGLGVHLCLTAGKPVLSPERVPSLVKPDGTFFREGEFVARLPIISIEEVKAEWQAQVDVFCGLLGRAPDHLNSHHHTSYFTEKLFEEMLQLAEGLGCRIRRPSGEDSENLPGQETNFGLDQIMSAFESKGTAAKPLTTQGYFGSFYDEDANFDVLSEALNRMACHKTINSFEIMTHPAIVDEELMKVSSYNLQRDREREILQDQRLVKFAAQHFELLRFADLA